MMEAVSDLMKPGHQISKPDLLFEKIEDSEIEKQIDKLNRTKKANDVGILKEFCLQRIRSLLMILQK